MNPMTIVSSFGNGIIHFAKKNDTKLMTVAVCGGVAATGILSGKAAIKAYKVLEEEEYTSEKPLTTGEKVKKTWKFFLPPFAAAVATMTVATLTESVNLSKQAALFEAYTIAKNARVEFSEAAKKVMGEKKVEKVREEIVKDKIAANPPTDENIIYTTHGDTLCREGWHGRYFKSDIAFIKDVFNKLNDRINSNPMNIVTMEDLFLELDLPPLPRDKYWEFSQDTGIMRPTFTSGLTETTGLPYFSFDFDEYNEPIFSR